MVSLRPGFPRFVPRGAGLDLTSLVDVMFTLVLFFTVTHAWTKVSGVTVDVPAAVNVEAVPEGAVEVVIRRDGVVLVGERAATDASFRAAVAAAARDRRAVLITGDRGASLGRVLEVWDACKGAGVRQLHIRTATVGGGNPNSQIPNPK